MSFLLMQAVFSISQLQYFQLSTIVELYKIKGLKETTHGYKKERNKANDFTCKLQYDVSIFSNRRQSDFTKCSLMISQREIMISRLV